MFEDTQKDYEVRIKKVETLQSLNISSWPEFRKNNTNASLVVEKITNNNFTENEILNLSGRVILKRDHGKSFFGTLRDPSGSVQFYLKQDFVEEEIFDLFLNFIDVGDFIWISGLPFVTKTGTPTIKVIDFCLLSKSLRPLPEKFHGLVDTEQRYRQRYLDLLGNADSVERFKNRSKIVNSIRMFLTEKDFIEVETPMLHSIAGGAVARPFVTHHNTYDIDLFLRIAPELYLKRLVVGGFDRVFEINRNFRNEGVSTKHNPEFTMLEFYMAYGDYLDGIELTQNLLKKVALNIKSDGIFMFGEHEINFTNDFAVLSIFDSLIKVGNFSKEELSDNCVDQTLLKHEIKNCDQLSLGEKLYKLFDKVVEAKLIQPTFITGFPIEVSPLAKQDPSDSSKAARFELFICGMELANGYSELNDPIDQAKRFQAQVKNKEQGDDEAHSFDSDYILALEHGLPPTVGVGIGIDRLTMLLTNTQSIKDVILFPTMRPKI